MRSSSRRRAAVMAAFVFLTVTMGLNARASVSIAVTFDTLVRDAASVGLMTPVEQHALWENGRIVTYTRVHVDRAIAGRGAASDVWVATLGGRVGDVGQIVDGEPRLHVGVPSLLFLRPDTAAGVFIVTARAQGQFPLGRDGRLARSNAIGELVAPRVSDKLAGDVIAERPVEDVARDVAAAWSRLHAR